MHRKFMLGTAAVASLMLLAACNRNEVATNPPADQTATATNPNAPADQTAQGYGTNAPADQTANANNPNATYPNGTTATDQTAQNNNAPGSRNETVSATKDAIAGAVGTVSAELTTTSKGFANAAAISDMYEVQAGQLAATRAKDPELKKFAQQMVDAHTQSSNMLKPIAMKSIQGWMPPTDLDTRRQTMLNDLKGASDQDFDNRYIAQQINAHNEALILMRGFAKDGDNKDIQKFATDMQPKVQMHLDMINEIDRKHRAGNAQAQNRGNTQTR